MYTVGSVEASFYFEEIVCWIFGYVYIFSIDLISSVLVNAMIISVY